MPTRPPGWPAKVARLRVFADAEGRMNRSLLDVGGEALVVSQFTLYARREPRQPAGLHRRRPAGASAPSWWTSSPTELRELGVPVATGRFGAHMQVHLVNDGPVTIWLDIP